MSTAPAVGYRRLDPKRVSDDRMFNLLIGSPARDFWGPIVLIALGSVVYFARATYSDGISRGLLEASVQIVFNVIATGTAILLLGRLVDMDFGPAAGTMLKLAAVAIFPTAAAGAVALVDVDGWPVVVALLTFPIISAILFRKLFDLDLSSTALCVSVGFYAARLILALS